MSVLVNMLHSSSIIVYVFLRWLNLNISRFRCHLVVSFLFFFIITYCRWTSLYSHREVVSQLWKLQLWHWSYIITFVTFSSNVNCTEETVYCWWFFFAEGHSALCLLQQEQGKKGGSTFAQLYSILSVDGWKLFFVFFVLASKSLNYSIDMACQTQRVLVSFGIFEANC